MFLYYGISFVFSVLAVAAWMYAAVTHVSTFHGDGSGPDGLLLVLYLSFRPVGLLLVHSALLAWVVRTRNPASVMQGRLGLPVHAALGAGFSLCALYLFYLS